MRIGVFGGSFDPPHAAHAAVAKAACEQASLDTLMWVPTFHPPHKPGPSAPYPHRLGMVQALIGGQKGWQASDIESSLGGPSFTLPTLRALKSISGKGHSWFLLIGADNWAAFSKWHEPAAVLAEAHLIVHPRQKIPVTGLPPGSILLPGPELPDESRRLRGMLATDPELALAQLPGPVADWIRRNRLYSLAGAAP